MGSLWYWGTIGHVLTSLLGISFKMADKYNDLFHVIANLPVTSRAGSLWQDTMRQANQPSPQVGIAIPTRLLDTVSCAGATPRRTPRTKNIGQPVLACVRMGLTDFEGPDNAKLSCRN